MSVENEPTAGARQREGVDVLQALRPLEPRRLADHVVAQLQELILSEGIKCGERLPSERDLAQRLGTSRAIISQALRTLSLMGCVEVRRGSGAYITREPQSMFFASMDLLFQSQETAVRDLAELRYWLEDAATRKAMSQRSERLVADLEEAFARLESNTPTTSEWMAADTIFHAALVRASGNSYLVPLYEAVHTAVVYEMYREWVERDVVPNWLRGESRQDQLDLHRPIVEAVRDGDVDALRNAVRHHHVALEQHLERRPGRTEPAPN